MKLFFGDTSLEITVSDNSKAIEKVRAVDTFTLYFSMPEYVDIPVGAWTTFEGKRYELLDPKNFKKNNTRNFEYTLVLEDDAGKLRRYKHRDSNTRRLKFEYTARPHEHVQMLVNSLNKRDGGWTVGDCIEAVEKVVAFNHTNCWDALEQIADVFGTEWEIENKRISLRKIEYFRDNPLPLSYGKGNGFKSGIGRQNQDKKTPVEILYPQGGSRNIDPSTYGSTELLLPKGQAIGFDGSTYYYDPSEVPAGRDVKWYITDADGFSISRKDEAFVTFAEDSLDCSEIYPSREGTFSSVVVVDAEKHLYDVLDSSIPENLDFSAHLIQGMTLTIIPQEGMLAGKEFDAKYIHADRRFEIVPQDLDGRTMPDDIFKPMVGQRYAVFGMMMPDAYICDNLSHTGASWDMFRECARYFFDNDDPHFTFTGDLDSIWAQTDWLNIGGRIRKGAYCRFSDTQFQPDGVDIRMVSVTRPANTPKKVKIELSNVTVSSSIIGELNKIAENEVIAENQTREAVSYTKRRLRDAEEHFSLIDNAVQGFDRGISPSWIHSMAGVFGHDTLQFVFVDDKTTPEAVDSGIRYDNDTKVLTAPAGILQHKTIGITSLSPIHSADEYSYWDLPALTFPRLDTTDPLYVYAKCSKSSSTGEFLLSTSSMDFDNADGNYYLLIGTLSSEYEGIRSYVESYGFTEVLPGRITLWKIIDPDGFQFWDMLNKAFRIGNTDNYLDYNTRGDGKMRLKGTIFQSESGDEAFPGVFRGKYNASTTYHPGDEVTYTVNGSTSTYRYTAEAASAGIAPTNLSYWQVVASAGSDGDYYEYLYAVNGSRTSPPSLSAATVYPSGWSTSMPSISTLQYIWCTVAKKSANGTLLQNWSTPTRITGADGAPGPTVVFRGEYSSSAIYYGTSTRVDVVKYNNVFYIARSDAGNGFSASPLSTLYWNDFGAQFDMIATNLLLADGASLGNWFIQGGKIVSTLGTGNKITLDATMAEILIESAVSGGAYSMNSMLGSIIELDANQGIIGVRAKNRPSYSTGTAYMSPTGIFANLAGTDALPSSTGLTHRGAIVGLGFADVDKYQWSLGGDETIVAGVYGRASNSGTAPAFGGYFWNLKACGLILNRRIIHDGSPTTTQLNESDVLIISITNTGVQRTVYLPNDGIEGRIVRVIQMGGGSVRVATSGGQVLADDATNNDYFDVANGETSEFSFGIWNRGGVTSQIWSMGQYKF